MTTSIDVTQTWTECASGQVFITNEGQLPVQLFFGSSAPANFSDVHTLQLGYGLTYGGSESVYVRSPYAGAKISVTEIV
jgi:hypothetical protein